MELLLFFFGILNKIINFLITPILILIFGLQKKILPKNKDPILEISAVDLAEKIRNRELTSEQVVTAYIKRIKVVDVFLNAMIEDRFVDAMNDAKKADKIISETSPIYVIRNYPLLGVPFTVKESISLKGKPQVTGSVSRKDVKAMDDAEVVKKLKAAGAIPLLVSTNPELCLSWECSNPVTGRTYNAYDLSRTSGGSSGGEGALIGAAASPFGIGSDIAGSVRIPSLFNGIFGHKPTPGVIPLTGHFPYVDDKNYTNYLTVGPMCRYSKDLPTLTYLMADESCHNRLRLDQPILTKDIKIFYQTTAGFSLPFWNVELSIQRKILEAVSHFKNNGVECEVADFDMSETLEISIATFFSMENIPNVMGAKKGIDTKDLLSEFGKSILNLSEYSFYGLYFAAIHTSGGFVRSSKKGSFIQKGIELREKMLKALGTNGVLFYPTFPQSAMRHCESPTKMSGVMYSMLFNLFGFPSTHVPMGKDENGLPIGFQVIASPFQDRNCFAIARELEAAFGGWRQ